MKNLNLSQKIVAALILTIFVAAVILARLNAAGFNPSQFTV